MELRFNQSDFSAGQFGPTAFARDDYIKYYKAAQTIDNAVVIPQGGVQTRWGTDFVASVPIIAPQNIELSTLTYDDNAVYLLVWFGNLCQIYLEDVLIASVLTPYNAVDMANLQFCQVQNRLIVANQNYQPYQLSRSANAPVSIIGYSEANNTLTVPGATFNGNAVYPIQFAATGTLPTTIPHVFTNRTYFMYVFPDATIQLFDTSDEAAAQINPYQIFDGGTSAKIIAQNTWTFSPISFINVPSYDFTGGYSSITFTISATDGDITLTASAPIFSAAYVNGVFSGNGGAMRLTGYTDTTHMTGYTTETFLDTDPIHGATAYLGQPAWSNTNGWPRAVGFWQSRLVFGGSNTINNGVWLSQTNGYYNFDDSDNTNPDDSISWYPSSGGSSFIRSITSARSLLIHTTTGTYSTTINSDTPATPLNFNLIEQNKDGVSGIQPVFIDNQVIYVDQSGNNAKNLIFDIIQGAYILNNISVTSSNCINQPVDIATLTEPNFTDGAYVLFVNADGSLGIFQTLIEQNIAAWTTAHATNSDGTPAAYCHVASSLNDCWFVVQRTVDGSTVYYVERADFDTQMDCTTTFKNVNSATVNGLSYLEGQTVYANADGFLVPPQVVTDGAITLPSVSQTVQVGLLFITTLTLLPIGAIPQTPANLYKPMRAKVFYIYYYNTVGGTIAGAQIQTMPLNQIYMDQPITPETGVKEIKLMGGWDMMAYNITIQQTQPLPMTILGVGYVLEIP